MNLSRLIPGSLWLKPLATAALVAAVGCGAPPSAQEQEQDQEQTQPEAFVHQLGTSKSAVTASARIIRPSAATQFCLQPQNGATDNGTPVQIGACNNGATQTWLRPDGSFRLGNKCIDVAGGNTNDGTRLQLWDCDSNNKNQKFKISGKSIAWQDTTKCFDLTGGQRSAGTVIQIWTCDGGNVNQQWSVQTVDAAGSSTAVPAAQAQPNVSSDYAVNYLKTSGTQIRDKNNQQVVWRGTNIGGWLVTEGWMNGYTDASDKKARFTRETLERRFGNAKAQILLNAWYDKFFTSADMDIIQNMGINTIRVPFGWRNLQNADGSWIKNSSGNIDFGRLDWIVAEAAKRNIYVILDFHIWDTQQQDYDLISTNTDGGHQSQARAAAIWTEVAKHFKGNAAIAAYDVINEPTGSWGNMMQDALYKAVRAQDAQRIIVMESMNADPKTLGWSQVVYSIHQYGMMGNDFGTNQNSFNTEFRNDIQKFSSFNIPTYIGEFMTQESGPTLAWLLQQYKNNSLSWTNWTYKTVNMGAWGLQTLPAESRVDVLNDSYDKILNTWQNLSQGSPQTPVVNAFKAALGR